MNMAPDVTTSWIPLPDDVLSEIIFNYIPLCQWSVCLEYISKQFQNCVLITYKREKSINFRKLYPLIRSIENSPVEMVMSARLNDILKKLLAVCPNLKHMTNLPFSSRYTDFDTWNILKQFHSLQSIYSMCLDRAIQFGRFADFVASCKSLENLSIVGCGGHYRCFDVVGALDVGSINTLIIPEMVQLVNVSDKLTSLKIGSIGSKFKKTCDVKIAMKMLTNLVSFSIGIKDENDYEILFLNILPNLCKLTSLSVQFYFMFDIGEEFYGQLGAIRNQLRCLEIIGPSLTDEAHKFIFTQCLQLESLNLECLFGLSCYPLENLRNFPVKLKQLAFTEGCDSIFPVLLPNLVQLSNFTDLTISMSNLAVEWEDICCLNSLRNLHIDGSCVNDALVEKWDKKNSEMFEKLISLKMSNCRKVSDSGACLLAKKAINLKCLDLSEARISDKTILTFADVAKKLTDANFIQSKPYLFDETAILYLVKKAVCLKKLTIENPLADNVVQHDDFLLVAENVELVTKIAKTMY